MAVLRLTRFVAEVLGSHGVYPMRHRSLASHNIMLATMHRINGGTTYPVTVDSRRGVVTVHRTPGDIRINGDAVTFTYNTETGHVTAHGRPLDPRRENV